MGLYDRLLGQGTGNKIAVHSFNAALWEVVSGAKTAADLKAIHSMDATASSELDTLLATISGNLSAKSQRVAEIHFVLMLAEDNMWYPTVAALKTRLGV